MRFSILILFTAVIFCYCQSKRTASNTEHAVKLSAGDLTATFVDNEAMPPVHRAGYNGIAVLMHKGQADSLYVPLYAGFNLEHVFSGDSMVQKFEPRKHPMKITQIADNAVELYQTATPLSKVESWTTFTIQPPHYIEIEFKCVIHASDFFPHGYAGLFWASYINAPKDKHIYFWGYSEDDQQPRWISAFSEKHGERSTHISAHDQHRLFFAENFSAAFLAKELSGYRFLKPFYYGRFRDMVLIYMFDNDQHIRFSQSPTGGGPLNPAWDFQLIIDPLEVETAYSFRSRIVYKPFENNDDVVNEFNNWRRDLSAK